MRAKGHWKSITEWIPAACLVLALAVTWLLLSGGNRTSYGAFGLTVTARDTELGQVLQDISEQIGAQIRVNGPKTLGRKKVSLDVKDQDVHDVLDDLLGGPQNYNLDWKARPAEIRVVFAGDAKAPPVAGGSRRASNPGTAGLSDSSGTGVSGALAGASPGSDTGPETLSAREGDDDPTETEEHRVQRCERLRSRARYFEERIASGVSDKEYLEAVKRSGQSVAVHDSVHLEFYQKLIRETGCQ